MPRVEFDALPDRGRLWVFPATQALTSAQSDAFLHEVDSFLDAWAAHGIPLRCGRQLRDDQFLIIGVDVDAEAPSGCSIDALVNRLRGLPSRVRKYSRIRSSAGRTAPGSSSIMLPCGTEPETRSGVRPALSSVRLPRGGR